MMVVVGIGVMPTTAIAVVNAEVTVVVFVFATEGGGN